MRLSQLLGGIALIAILRTYPCAAVAGHADEIPSRLQDRGGRLLVDKEDSRQYPVPYIWTWTLVFPLADCTMACLACVRVSARGRRGDGQVVATGGAMSPNNGSRCDRCSRVAGTRNEAKWFSQCFIAVQVCRA